LLFAGTAKFKKIHAEEGGDTMAECTICGGGESEYALPLKRENGKWVAKPICGKCRKGLLSEARATGKSIMIYGLEGSQKEAERRNSESGRYRLFLDAFAKAGNAKAVRKNGNGKPVRAEA